jgi:hypothetical protein
MKEFAARLARMVYERKLSDARIVEEFANSSNKPDELWLRQQIRTVRTHPEIYKSMAGVRE